MLLCKCVHECTIGKVCIGKAAGEGREGVREGGTGAGWCVWASGAGLLEHGFVSTPQGLLEH